MTRPAGLGRALLAFPVGGGYSVRTQTQGEISAGGAAGQPLPQQLGGIMPDNFYPLSACARKFAREALRKRREVFGGATIADNVQAMAMDALASAQSGDVSGAMMIATALKDYLAQIADVER